MPLAVLLALTLLPAAGRGESANKPSGSDGEGSLRLVFSAETRGNLLPCDCPGAPYGGLAQRSAFVRSGGPTSREDGLAEDSSASPVLRLHAGGFLPAGDVPLRRDVGILRRYLELLLDDLDHARFDAIGLGPEEAAFLQDQDVARFRVDDPRWLVFGRHDLRLFPWNGRRIAVVALDANWPEDVLAARGAAARSAGDLVIVLARANAASGQKIAEAARPDLVILSEGANLESPLKRTRSLAGRVRDAWNVRGDLHTSCRGWRTRGPGTTRGSP